MAEREATLADTVEEIAPEKKRIAREGTNEEEEDFTRKKKGKKGKGGKKGKKKQSTRPTDDEEATEEGPEKQKEGPSEAQTSKKKKGKKKATTLPVEQPVEQKIERLDTVSGDKADTTETVETIVKVEGDQIIEESPLDVPMKDKTVEEDNKKGDEMASSSGDEKRDEKKDSEGEESKETRPEEKPSDVSTAEGREERSVRRRATLSDLKGESIDKGDDSVGQQSSNKNLDRVTEASEDKEGKSAGSEETADLTAKENTQDGESKTEETSETVAIEMDPAAHPVPEVAVEIEESTAEEKTASTEGGKEDAGPELAEVAVAIEGSTQKTKPSGIEGGKGVDLEHVSEVALDMDGEKLIKNDGENVEEDSAVTSETPATQTAFLEYEIDDELPWAMYRSLDAPPGRRPVEEEDEWPPSEEEEDYVPPKDDTLPDLDELLGTLDGGDSQLVTSATPPPLVPQEEKQVQQKQINDLKLGMAEERIERYDEQFNKKVEDEILMIGHISLEEVQEEERRLRDEGIAYQHQMALKQRSAQEDILKREALAKKEVMRVMKTKRKNLQKREDLLMQQDRLVQNRIHRSFQRAEGQLLKALTARKGEVQAMYGDLMLADGQYGGSKGRRWKVDWNRTPQPIQIKLKCLRGVKDKLPGGRYVLMVSLYDRLGGHVLKWSNLKGQQWGGATLPLNHDGEFYNIEVKIDQSVFTVCPARPDVRPGMVLLFELFILRGSVTPTDRVVGWGCFPVCDGRFNIVEGRYKAPFLRGDMDASIDKHEKIEELMADDLENWLCNLYFEVVKLPRYMAGQKEYEVELQFTSGILSYPSRTNVGEEVIDGEEPIFGSRLDLKSAAPGSGRMSAMGSSFFGSVTGGDTGDEKDPTVGSTMNLQVEVPGVSARKDSLFVPDTAVRRRSSAFSERRGSAVSQRRQSRPMTVHMSRKAVELEASSDGEGSGTDYSEDEILVLKKDDGFRPVKGQPGMYYKKHLNNPVDVYAKKVYTMMPKTQMLTRKNKRKKKLTHLEELDEHSFVVKPPFSNKGGLPRRGREKIQYVSRQLLAEVGLSQWRSREFWAMLLMIAITWWIRLYAHYGGQWVYLSALLIPVNKFDFLPFTVKLNYQSTILRSNEEITMVIIGPFTNVILFCLMIIWCWFMQRLFGMFPNIFSRFIMAFGINTLLDPLWILIVDCALERYKEDTGMEPIGDAFKLYWHFDRYENNGAVGIVLTIFLYIVTLFTASTMLYMYFLRLHNHGRLMDVYHRLHAREDQFFLPYDLEISNEELNFICKKAEQWRGEEGERRKVAVYDYLWEEEQIDESGIAESSNNKNNDKKKTGHREITTHVSIHTLHLDGLRELYRHFLRLPDGAIVEVFGEMGVAGMDESVKQALVKGTNHQGSARGSRASVRARSRAGSAISRISADSDFNKPSVMLEVPKTARSPSPV